jgi:hypothetical protein
MVISHGLNLDQVDSWFASEITVRYDMVRRLIEVVVTLSRNDSEGILVLQDKLDDYDQQDLKLNLNSYCLSDELGRTVYGCVVDCEIQPATLYLELSDAAVSIGWQRQLKIDIPAQHGVEPVLYGALSRIFRSVDR